MEDENSKILIFGGTGYIGRYMVKASVLMGHRTYVYSRPVTSNTSSFKLELHQEFERMGVKVIQGGLDDHENLVSVLQQVDVVISTLPIPQVLEQLKIIDAMKIAGNIKRFFPSDFAMEEDKVMVLPPFQACLDNKKVIRRAIEAAGIPYTFVSANCFGMYFVSYLLHPHEQCEEVTIYGNGETKVVFNFEEDIAVYTIKAARDPRARNQVIIYRPPNNIVSQLDLISSWEEKIGRKLKRIHVAKEELVKLSECLPHPENIRVSVLHSISIEGCLMNFDLGEHLLEASTLYPDYEYTSVDHLLDICLLDPPKPSLASF